MISTHKLGQDHGVYKNFNSFSTK